MNKKLKKLLYKWKIVVYAMVALIGVILIFIAKGRNTEEMIYSILLGIGCSIIATAFVTIIIFSLLPNEDDETEPIQEKWGILSAYTERQHVKLSKNNLPRKQLDFIAFGLSHFRSANQGEMIKKRIINGLDIRIITLHPNSKYVVEQENWENHSGIRNDIFRLLDWKDSLVKDLDANAKGSIEIKLYDSLPMSFYCRADNKIYAGPYVPKKHSGDVITFEFEADSVCGQCFSQHFEDLWGGDKLEFVSRDRKYYYGSQKDSIEGVLKHFCDQMKQSGGTDVIGVVVVFKDRFRRTFFSCNKSGTEHHNCYTKDKGAVGQLVSINNQPNNIINCLFRDYINDLTFVKVDTGRDGYLEKKNLSFSKFKEDDMQAILAAPIMRDNEMIGAVTFDFASFPELYSKQIECMKNYAVDTRIYENVLVSDWLSASAECASIVEKMLGDEINVLYGKLYDEEWKCNE